MPRMHKKEAWNKIELYMSILTTLYMISIFLAFLDIKITKDSMDLLSLTVDDSLLHTYELNPWVRILIKYLGTDLGLTIHLFVECMLLTILLAIPLETKKEFIYKAVIFLMIIYMHYIGIIGWIKFREYLGYPLWLSARMFGKP